MPQGIKSGNIDFAREFVLKYGKMPDGKTTPTRKLARMMYEKSPARFKDEEGARRAIRQATGKAGDYSRKAISKKEFFIEGEQSKNPYKLPESHESSYEPYYIEGSRILILSDIHIPYHNIPALTAAIGWAESKDIDTILLNGDTLDFFQLSRFVKEPEKRSFADELNAFKDFISSLRAVFTKAKIIFKEGNHEERYNHFLYMKANELAGVSEFSLENIIRTRAADIDYIGMKRIIKAGELNIIHGHEFAGGTFSPVNIARGLFLKAKVSCMQGHNHQTSEHTESNMNGRITTTWSIGCLSELHPQYMPLNKWNHGFAFVEVEPDGSFQVQNKRIHKGEVL